MTSISISRCCQAAWEDVLVKVNKAVVFLDGPAAECLHWACGGEKLVTSGALNIKEFSSFESGSSNERKAVFILTSPLTGTTRDILRDILKASEFQYVIVVSTLSPSMHSLICGYADDEFRTFHDLEDLLLEWMNNMNYSVEVTYKPLMTAPITPHLFAMPQHSDLFPFIPTDIQHLQKVHQKDGVDTFELDFTHLGREAQLELKLLVCSLNSLMEQMSISEDCYALGPTSKIVAGELASLSWAKTRRKSAQNKASLLLVDRTLDIASVVGHQSETLLDRILCVLPRLPGHSVDVQVNMTSFCSVPSNSDTSVIVPGCLAHPNDGNASQLLNKMASVKQKEAQMDLNRLLVETASSQGLPLKLSGKPGRVNVEQLKSTASLFKGKSNIVRRHAGLLQLSMAAIETLSDESISKLDSLLGVEKGLVSCVGDETLSQLISQLTHTVNKEMEQPASDRMYSLEDIFLLLVFIYSLVDVNDIQDTPQERILRAALVGAILEETDSLPPFLSELLGLKYREDKVCQVLDDIFFKLKGLATARAHLKQFRHVCEPGGVTSPSCLKPLLKQAMDTIFSADKTELTDITYKSTGFRDLLKSGFGLFMNVSKPRPSDHPLLIVFVIGGVTPTEVKQVKDAVSASKSNVQVMVGSTCVVRPEDVLQRLLAQDNLFPTIHSV